MTTLILSIRRIYAVIYRYVTLLLRSPPRLLEAIYWPAINTALMGFLNYYLLRARGVEIVNFHSLLGATFMMEFFLRTQMGMMLVLVEEIYARNLPQLYASPLRPSEQVFSTMLISLMRVVLGVTPAIVLAQLLFGYDLFSLGAWFWPFASILVLSGLVCGLFLISLLLRFGQSAEWCGWMLGWSFIPFMGVYYPVDVLPGFMQGVGAALPPSYVFSALRSFAEKGVVDPHGLWVALALNLFYLQLALFIFFRTLKGARRRGALLSLNE